MANLDTKLTAAQNVRNPGKFGVAGVPEIRASILAILAKPENLSGLKSPIIFPGFKRLSTIRHSVEIGPMNLQFVVVLAGGFHSLGFLLSLVLLNNIHVELGNAIHKKHIDGDKYVLYRRHMEKQDRDKRIPVLLTAEEKREIEQAASAEGLPASTWMRWIALREARVKTQHP